MGIVRRINQKTPTKGSTQNFQESEEAPSNRLWVSTKIPEPKNLKKSCEIPNAADKPGASYQWSLPQLNSFSLQKNFRLKFQIVANFSNALIFQNSLGHCFRVIETWKWLTVSPGKIKGFRRRTSETDSYNLRAETIERIRFNIDGDRARPTNRFFEGLQLLARFNELERSRRSIDGRKNLSAFGRLSTRNLK